METVIQLALYGYLQWPWWAQMLYLVGMAHVTLMNVTVFLHRTSAHRALDMHPFLAWCFRLWTWLTTGQIVQEFIAVHRKHHAKDDKEGDPHSPHVHGLGKVFWQGVELYREEAKNPETIRNHGVGAPDGKWERLLFGNKKGLMKYAGVGTMLVIDVLLFGLIGITIWAIQMLVVPVLAAGVINGFGHWPMPWGRRFFYRNGQTQDWSVNICSWGVVICGEELHNNHHLYPTSAKLSLLPHEFDIGWMYIRIFERLGWVKVKYIHGRTVN